MPTLSSPASSAKWRAYYTREDISSTLISAARNFVAGQQLAAVTGADRRQLPAFIRPFGRRFAGVPGTGLYRLIENGDAEYRMYCFAKD
jgi:hypothetical protein